jgi:predicted adenylyl cyclase CyaB
MPANIEVKARIDDPEGFRELATSLSDTPVEIIPQEDVFFRTAQGRLKLRILRHAAAQLVYYTRRDAAGPKRSDYQIVEVRDAEGTRMLLGQALGVRGVVRKTRRLYRIGQTRVHFDEVAGLGTFAELEVVLREGQSDADGLAIAQDLMTRLRINSGDLVEEAYIDLIEGKVPD